MTADVRWRSPHKGELPVDNQPVLTIDVKGKSGRMRHQDGVWWDHKDKDKKAMKAPAQWKLP